MRFTLTRRMRLARGKDFLAVRRGGVRVTAGPLQISMRPNDLGLARLGLSVSRRVGSAVVRNKLKRRLREAFRLMQHEWADLAPTGDDGATAVASRKGARVQGYDVIVGAKAHLPITLAEYRLALAQAVREAHQVWQRKNQRRARRPTRQA
jgi:ribonuclease P protein component